MYRCLLSDSRWIRFNWSGDFQKNIPNPSKTKLDYVLNQIHWIGLFSLATQLLSNFEITRDDTRGRLRILRELPLNTRVVWNRGMQNTHVVWLLVWNTQSTACDITSNIEVGQRVEPYWYIVIIKAPRSAFNWTPHASRVNASSIGWVSKWPAIHTFSWQ